MPVKTGAMSHTPGPWEVRSDLPYTSHGLVVFHGYHAENRTVCRLREGTPEEIKANAELIASAPLLEERVQALEKALRTNFEALNRMLTSFVGSDDELCMECGNRVGKGEGCDTCYVIEEATKAVAEAERVLEEKP